MSQQKINIEQFKEAINLITRVFKDLGEQRDINILPLLGGISGVGNIHMALIRLNLMAQQIEREQVKKNDDEKADETVDKRYKSETVIL